MQDGPPRGGARHQEPLGSRSWVRTARSRTGVPLTESASPDRQPKPSVSTGDPAWYGRPASLSQRTRRPYPSYRDSGVEWLGEIPKHWEIQRLGRMGSFFKGGGGTKEDEVDNGIPCVRYGDLYTQHQFLIRGTRAGIGQDSVERYRQLRYGDVLFAGSGETIDEIGKSAANLIQGPAYCGGDVIVFRPSIEVDATFLGYATDSRATISQKACMGRGVTVMHIYSSELKYMLLPMPPLDEQRSIARFLDHETTKIDELVAKKRLLIERLSEYRTALITRTVTRGLPPAEAEATGLDPDPLMKDSGVEWIGEVPEHWEVTRLRRFVKTIRTGTTPPSAKLHELEGDDIAWFSPGDIGSVLQMAQPARTLAYSAVADGLTPLFPAESTLIVGIGATTGRVGHNTAPSTGNQQLTCIVGNMHAIPRFLSWQLWAHTRAIRAIVPFATLPILNNAFLLSLSFVAPPLREQQAIAAFLAEQTEQIAVVCERVEAAVERLQEYRTALVTAAVTGKIDVRDPAIAMAGSVRA